MISIEIINKHDILSVFITDKGEGIPEDSLKKIWDPFFTSKEKGTGLGLSIVKNIIEAHRGKINIKNMHEGGACVCIDLPIA
ncbi:hypothetical protein GMMP13_420054 [Candidatus Magnetomoraceae bacterium gMMP-13]